MQNPGFTEGSIFYTTANGQFQLFKLLVQEEDTCHVLIYTPVPQLPNVADIAQLAVDVFHAPISIAGFQHPVLLAQLPITADDLIGYHAYLQETMDVEEYAPLARHYYSTAYELTNQQQHHQAIDAYSKAIDLVPHFYQAIDNRAFCKMDLGLWEEAIEDFILSLEENPGSLLAEFSIGECYFKQGDYAKALPYFEKAHQIDPTHPAPADYIDKTKALL